MCSVCEPVLPDEDRGVTRYPMKVERKKAREEVDLVNVIEWRSTFGDRHFVLARRPETGTKILYFPTLPYFDSLSFLRRFARRFARVSSAPRREGLFLGSYCDEIRRGSTTLSARKSSRGTLRQILSSCSRRSHLKNSAGWRRPARLLAYSEDIQRAVDSTRRRRGASVSQKIIFVSGRRCACH